MIGFPCPHLGKPTASESLRLGRQDCAIPPPPTALGPVSSSCCPQLQLVAVLHVAGLSGFREMETVTGSQVDLVAQQWKSQPHTRPPDFSSARSWESRPEPGGGQEEGGSRPGPGVF